MTRPQISMLETIRSLPPGRGESLVACLHALVTATGAQANHDELSVLSGTAFMTSYAPDAPAGLQWNVYGRHAFLVDAARLYGLDLRELHPPAASPGVPTPREFDWHFHDSYLPLIRVSLDRDEPVLTWMGWPGAGEWGIITDAAAGACRGWTPQGNAELVGTPVQVYTVARFDAPEMNIDAVLDGVRIRARLIVENRIDASFGVVSGVTAAEAWRADLARGFMNETGRRVACMAFNRFLDGMVAGRCSVTRFASTVRDVASPRHRDWIDAWVAQFGSTAGGLAPWVGATVIDEALAMERPIQMLEPLLELIEESERAVAQIMTSGR